ncbi:hypothetical protein [Nitrospirillum pindoramense]|nr:hypothetical protein [Nitrospirillum amazonense]
MERKLLAANHLLHSLGFGYYEEAALVVCSGISAAANFYWVESARTDKLRFSEILYRAKQHAGETIEPDPTRISISALKRRFPEIQGLFPDTCKPLTMVEADDLSEDEVLARLRAAGRNKEDGTEFTFYDVRAQSYANLLYVKVRCGLVHEGAVANEASADNEFLSMPGRLNSRTVRYVSAFQVMLDEDDEETGEPKHIRQIHFPMPWLCDMARACARFVDAEREERGLPFWNNLRQPWPVEPWLEVGRPKRKEKPKCKCADGAATGGKDGEVAGSPSRPSA